MKAMRDPILIFIDADACPVKDEVYRVAERYGIMTYVVSNSWINVPRSTLIERVVVPPGPDVADNWIAARARAGVIVITADIPLAARCLRTRADVLGPTGRIFNDASIGLALATRNLMDELRSAGETTRGPRPFSPRDRSNFLSTLDTLVNRLKRDGYPAY